MTHEPQEDVTRPWPDRVVAVFNNGNSVIVEDDHCYVIRNWSGTRQRWGWSAWIFPEALKVLASLPDNPDDARTIRENVEQQPSISAVENADPGSTTP